MRRAALIGSVLPFVLCAGVALAEKIPNWAAPSAWTPSSAKEVAGAGPKTAFATLYAPVPLIPVTPCRMADTRAASGFPAGYGPPSLPGAHTQRTFTITGRCGVPAGASAASLNFTVWAPTTRGDIRVFPAGEPTPTVATLNWEANVQALANAAVVPLGTGGAITVQVDGPGTIDLIFDVNGYYSADVSSSNGAELRLTSNGLYTIYAVNTSLGGTAIMGQALGTGSSWGVYGEAHGTGPAVLGNNFGSGSGVEGSGSSGAGVYGSSTGGNVAGVLGVNNTAASGAVGVRGEGWNGVVGVSRAAGGVGVIGEHLTSGLIEDATGWLGFAGGTAYGVYASVGTIGCNGCTKQFVEPHPTDASKTIHYASLEGPEAGIYFRGTAQTTGRAAVIEVPDHFRWVTAEEGVTVQLTPVGAPAQLWIKEQSLDRIVVESSQDVRFHYLVQGIREAHRGFPVVVGGTEFAPRSPDARMASGWTEWAKARLVANGTYNADGTVNMETAERMGWAQKWREEERVRREAISLAPRGQIPSSKK